MASLGNYFDPDKIETYNEKKERNKQKKKEQKTKKKASNLAAKSESNGYKSSENSESQEEMQRNMNDSKSDVAESSNSSVSLSDSVVTKLEVIETPVTADMCQNRESSPIRSVLISNNLEKEDYSALANSTDLDKVQKGKRTKKGTQQIYSPPRGNRKSSDKGNEKMETKTFRGSQETRNCEKNEKFDQNTEEKLSSILTSVNIEQENSDSTNNEKDKRNSPTLYRKINAERSDVQVNPRSNTDSSQKCSQENARSSDINEVETTWKSQIKASEATENASKIDVEHKNKEALSPSNVANSSQVVSDTLEKEYDLAQKKNEIDNRDLSELLEIPSEGSEIGVLDSRSIIEMLYPNEKTQFALASRELVCCDDELEGDGDEIYLEMEKQNIEDATRNSTESLQINETVDEIKEVGYLLIHL